MTNDHFPQIEILALLAILVGAMGSCDVKANIQKPSIIDLEPQAFNTWLSGRFIEYPDPFEREVILLERRIEARGEQE